MNDGGVHNTILTDVYAWGCICYEVRGYIVASEIPDLTRGKDVHRQTTLLRAIVRLHRYLRVIRDGLRPTRPMADSPAWLQCGLQEQFWDLMESCWAREPAERPSVEHLLSAALLVDVVDDRPINAQLEMRSHHRTGRFTQIRILPTIEELERLLTNEDNED